MTPYLFGCLSIVGELILIALILVVIIGATLIKNAPEGYENKDGYHSGYPHRISYHHNRPADK